MRVLCDNGRNHTCCPLFPIVLSRHDPYFSDVRRNQFCITSLQGRLCSVVCWLVMRNCLRIISRAVSHVIARGTQMNPADIKDWLVPISSFILIISTSVGVWLSLKEYRLKLQAETRLTESTRAETDIRLLQLFTEILYIATGRRGEAIFSKEILDLLIQKNILTEDDFKDLDKLKSKISQAAIIAQVPGESSSNAAFASIATLAKRHPVLYESAIEALESFRNFKPQLSERYLDSIRKESTAGDVATGDKLS